MLVWKEDKKRLSFYSSPFHLKKRAIWGSEKWEVQQHFYGLFVGKHSAIFPFFPPPFSLLKLLILVRPIPDDLGEDWEGVSSMVWFIHKWSLQRWSSASHMHFVLNTAYPLRNSASLLRQEDSRLMQLRMKSQGTEEKLICHMESGSNRDCSQFSLCWPHVSDAEDGDSSDNGGLILISAGCWFVGGSVGAAVHLQGKRKPYMLWSWSEWKWGRKYCSKAVKTDFLRYLFFSTLCITTLILYLWRGANERDSSFHCLFWVPTSFSVSLSKTLWHTLGLQQLVSHSENMYSLWWCPERGYVVVASTLPVFLGTSQIWKEDEHENIWFTF